MKILKNNLKHELNLRTEMDFPTKGVEFVDINPLIIQHDTLKEIVEFFVKKLSKKKIDYIVAPEARGFLFGMAIADNLNCGCIPVRKKGKLPPSTVEKTFEYEKEYGKDTLQLPSLVNDKYKNKRFYIVDDIYATGHTVDAIKKAIEELGGKVVGIACVINIVELNHNDKVLSIIDINEG